MLTVDRSSAGAIGRWCAGTALALCLAAPAMGQGALGDGQALDANPLVGSDGRNFVGYVPDFKSRNALITGDVVGGRGFRDTVGYTAANDFRGELGSNDTFGFRADSAWSNPTLFTTGQTLDLLRYGQQLGVVEYRRSGRGATLESVVREGAIDERLTLDQLSLTASGNMIYRGTIEPEFVGAFRNNENQPLIAAASSLRGLQVTPLAGQPQLMGLTLFDIARARQDAEGGQNVEIGAPFSTSFANMVEPVRAAESLAGSGRIEAPVEVLKIEPEYNGILQRIVDRYAETTEESQETPTRSTLATRLEDSLAQLRQQIGVEAPTDTEVEATTPEAAPDAPFMSIEDYGDILRHGEMIDRYATGDEGRFQELMAEAEEMLKRGEYFWAERRFTRALRFTPGHPLATAGLAHSQIGAGLYISAALSLRKLVAQRPEMIDATYGPDVLPNRVRLNAAIRVLREHIAKFEHDRHLNGFLLAYLGHQLDDRGLIEEGLGTLERDAPDDLLLPLLKSVWMPEPSTE